MPRQARRLSESGIYHVTFRGVGRMAIFRGTNDYRKLLAIMERTKAQDEYSLYAYCLMSNHVHLLLKAKDPLKRIITRICGPYAQTFNRKYDRVGHLFQGRYHSQIIDCEEYMLVCAQYIHNNPVRAGIAKLPQQYPWCSYQTYMNPSSPSDLIDRELLYSLHGQDNIQAAQSIKLITNSAVATKTDFIFLEPDAEDDSIEIIESILDSYCLSLETFRTAPRRIRRLALIQIIAETELSGRELATLLNIDRDVIYKVRRELT